MQALQGVTSEKTKQQTAFIVAMAALTAVFLLLLLLGNVWRQSDIIYLDRRDFQADTLKTEEYARSLDPYGVAQGDAHVPFAHANYPPLAYVIYFLLDTVSGCDIAGTRALIVSIAFTAIGALLLLSASGRLLTVSRGRRVAILAALLLSMPMAFAVERGNIILFAVALCGYFLLGYRSENRIVRELAFLALALAAALKIFPALLGLLLLSEKRFKEALRLAFYGAVLAFLPFLLLRGGFFGIPYLLRNFGAHTAFYDRYIYPRYGFRLFASLTYDAPWVNAFLYDQFWKVGDKLYAVMPVVDVMLSVGCALSALFAKRRFEAVLAIMLILINYPVNSGAYTSLYLLPVVAMYLSCETLTKHDRWTLVAFIFILSPLQIPFPKALLQQGETVLCNLTDILRNVAAYMLFAWHGARGYFLLKKKGSKENSMTA